MERPFFLFLSSCLCMLTVCAASQAQMTGRTNSPSRRVTIDGTVRSEDNSPIPNRIRVDLASPTGGVVSFVYTDDNGRFTFSAVTAGSYLLEVEETGYEPIRETLDASLGNFHGINLSLKKTLAQAKTENGPIISVHELALPKKAQDALRDGRKKLYDSNDAQGSVADFHKAIQAAPDCYEAYYDLGIAYRQLKQLDDAETALRKSSELSANKYGHANMALGVILAEEKKYDEAEKSLLLSVEAEPASWMGHYQLGRVYYSENRLTDAEKPLERARELKPDAPGVYRVLALVHLRLHNSAAALEDLNAFIKLDPDSAAGLQAKKMREQLKQSMAKEQSSATPAAAEPKP